MQVVLVLWLVFVSQLLKGAKVSGDAGVSVAGVGVAAHGEV